jgi:hypothetical protein
MAREDGPDIGGAAHRNNFNSLGGQITTEPSSERENRVAIACSLNENDGLHRHG